MNATRSILVIAGIIGCGALSLLPVGAQSSKTPGPAKSKPKPRDDKAIRKFMRQKLGVMKQVMRGIVTEDYAAIRRNAQAMKKMGSGVEWNIVQGPIYGNHRASFQRSAELLVQAADDKNADGAMLVYMQMTLNCIECHRYTRDPAVRRKYKLQ